MNSPQQTVVEHRYITEERQMIIDTARQFTLDEVLPVANRLDPVQGQIPDSLRQKLADMGYFGIRIPEAYGGSGLGCFEYCLITEQLARGWMSVASIIARGNGTLTIDLLSEEQKNKILPRVVEERLAVLEGQLFGDDFELGHLRSRSRPDERAARRAQVSPVCRRQQPRPHKGEQ